MFVFTKTDAGPLAGSIEAQARLLLDGSDWISRAKAADALAALFCTGRLGAEDQAAAEEVIRLTRFDGEVLVRRVLAEALKRARTVSRETVLLFTGDRADVAAPLIECSPVLGDSDLLRILREESREHRLAVARRYRVSERVAQPILSSGDEPVMAALLQNRGAAVPQGVLLQLAQARPLRPALAEALARRSAAAPGWCAAMPRSRRSPVAAASTKYSHAAGSATARGMQ